jgi:hypothetical protein
VDEYFKSREQMIGSFCLSPEHFVDTELYIEALEDLVGKEKEKEKAKEKAREKAKSREDRHPRP